MLYIIKVDDMAVKLCHSFHEAKHVAKKRGGKIYELRKANMPKAAQLSFNAPQWVKREMYYEIKSENNHGYHYTYAYKKKGE